MQQSLRHQALLLLVM